MSLLEIKNLTTSFATEQGKVQAVRGISLSVEQGEIVGIVGESGSGKSQSMYSVMGLLSENGTIEGGSILFDGQEISPVQFDGNAAAYEKLMEGIRQEIIQWLEDKAADLAFFSHKAPMPYDWIPLAEDRMVAVLPPGHPLADRGSYPLAQCAQEDFIMPALGRDDDVLGLLETHGLEPKIAFTTLDTVSALAMIQNDLGMSIMNELITKSWPGKVAILPLDPPQQLTLGVAVPSLPRAAPAVKAFLQFAVQALTQGQAEG